MSDPKGSHLYVNLSASQVRRRLKGFGHGVRKVQTAGRNQGVIIHTATGQHLTELEAMFSDVGSSSVASELYEPIENLRNLGPTSAAWLREVGISTIADLQKFGAVAAFRLVKQHPSKASLNLLWALAAGIMNCDWRELTDAEKEKLKQELENS